MFELIQRRITWNIRNQLYQTNSEIYWAKKNDLTLPESRCRNPAQQNHPCSALSSSQFIGSAILILATTGAFVGNFVANFVEEPNVSQATRQSFRQRLQMSS